MRISDWSSDVCSSDLQPEFRNGAARLKLLDQQGIHAQLIYQTLASAIDGRMNYDHELMAAALHSLNQWSLEAWGFNRETRLFAAPMVRLAVEIGRASCTERGCSVV